MFESGRTSKVYTTRLSQSYIKLHELSARISQDKRGQPPGSDSISCELEKSLNIKTVVELTQVSSKRK